jgi:hypothetical protein
VGAGVETGEEAEAVAVSGDAAGVVCVATPVGTGVADEVLMGCAALRVGVGRGDANSPDEQAPRAIAKAVIETPIRAERVVGTGGLAVRT